jgi:hypothetical protein
MTKGLGPLAAVIAGVMDGGQFFMDGFIHFYPSGLNILF